MTRLLTLIILITLFFGASAADKFVTFTPAENTIPLCQQREIAYDRNDWKGVKIAIENLKKDLTSVTGSDRAGIVIGTVGKSDVVKKYPAIAKRLKGKWEQYIITVDDDNNLVIIGSDKRGTIYGIYELSRQLGVSPWHWWADAPIARHDDVFIIKGEYTDGEPKVKYRGIFINDEWPSFGSWCNNLFGGINSSAYSKIFELLLRLKANYLWPAMWASSFNEDDPESPRLADEYGIVMGTSHHEPMMRAHKEYTRRRNEVGAWDYNVNKQNLDQFFREGLQRNKNYENLITIGMRGDGDVAMGKGDDEDNMNTLKDVIDGQRKIIREVYGKRAQDIPQLWAIFTEVQRYYDAGFNVPDDVTLLFCDNNWGYIRRTGTEREKGRKGGMGMYYHIDMNGGPWNDRWINTTTAAKLREQLNLAYQTGIDRIWIVNVGDLKPKEMPIDFIMKYAWDPESIGPDDVEKYMEDWARDIFGGFVDDSDIKEIARIVTEYSNLNLQRKPEVQTTGIYSAETGEAERMLHMWDNLELRVRDLSTRISPEAYDSFYQLVEYPAIASAGVAKIYLAATLNNHYAKLNDPVANEYANLAHRLYERDKELEKKYNHDISAGKWNGMMSDRHIGYTKWSMPDTNKLPELIMVDNSTQKKTVNTGKTHTLSHEIGIKAKDYTRMIPANGASWRFLPGVGRDEGDMGVWPVTAQSRPDGDGTTLEYDINFPNGSRQKLALGILPTNDVNPSRGLRVGIRIDNGEMMTVDARQGYVDTFNEYSKANIERSGVIKPLPEPASDIYLSGYKKPMRNEIFDNLRWLSIDFKVPDSGVHTLKIVMIDPEIVVEKLVINPDNNRQSYLGPRAI